MYSEESKVQKLSQALATTASHGAAKCVSLIEGFKSMMICNTLENLSISMTLLIDWNNPSNAEKAEETKYWSLVFEMSNKASHNCSILSDGQAFADVMAAINCKQ